MKSIIEEAAKLPSLYYVKTQWSERVAKGKPTDEEHLYYLVLCGVVAKRPETLEKLADRLKNSFPPVTNNNKKRGGRTRYDTLRTLLLRMKPPASRWSYNMSPQLGVNDFTHKEVQKRASAVISYVQ